MQTLTLITSCKGLSTYVKTYTYRGALCYKPVCIYDEYPNTVQRIQEPLSYPTFEQAASVSREYADYFNNLPEYPVSRSLASANSQIRGRLAVSSR